MTLNLTYLANRYSSDKGTSVGNRHNYTWFYSFLLEQWVEDHFTMLEIGLQRGDPNTYRDPSRPVTDAPSMRMWLDYFQNAQCWGFDLSDFSEVDLPRFTFRRGDLGSEDDLRRLAEEMPETRLIIDDGSHASYHQQLAFSYLFPKLAAGGLYIIEDLDWQPPYESQLVPCRKTADVFKRSTLDRDLDFPFLSSEQCQTLRKDFQNVFILRASHDKTKAGPIKLVCIQKQQVS